MPSIKTLTDVVDWRLCLGCGACAPLCPARVIELRNVIDEGIRPVIRDESACGSCRVCLDVCPVVQTDFGDPAAACERAEDRAFANEWGPVLQMWEGHATDEKIRFLGSSGGALTALGAFCIEKLGMHGVLHTGADPANPVLNRTRISRNREELMNGAGSRYSPASVCDGLGEVMAAPAPCVVVGKPVEISAVRNAEKIEPRLKSKVGVTMSFYCAETPPTQATLALLTRHRVDPASVETLRYRGHGWPGHFAPVLKGQHEPAVKQTYAESWAFLQSFRPWATQMWPDGGGELADISCGDPWYEAPDGKNPGFSLVVARTPLGKSIVERAIAEGYLTLSVAERWKLERSQAGLLNKKGSVWGRRGMMRLFGLPVTQFRGVNLYHSWSKLGVSDKLKSTFGTVRRILKKQIHKPRPRRSAL